ncbi:hypothetical protein B0H63DRAFT_519648 [Podospora didyma]|uniref:Uncharacterized protein n=1 Tax=Podospora didyma TaxID=330526 RepID=A0AAE0U4A7_9PEZI|nr:hypothetical protein B0H63DRAFT_519648 [Podospora didyma]
MGMGRTNPATLRALESHILEISSLKQSHTQDNGGSVLAIVTVPKDSDVGRACDGTRWHDMAIRMSETKLKELGSRKITAMFDEKHQKLYRRRWGNKPLPSGIEYILDFTPPAEGSELADLTAALWLPKMVKFWYLAGHFVPDEVLELGPDVTGFYKRPLSEKAVGCVLTLGHDDVCRSDECLTDFANWETKDVPGIFDESPSRTWKYVLPWRRVQDYCRIRHIVGIMRVLRFINGNDLLLNSAVRMWTVAQVAIHLEIPHVVVDPVTQWLIAPPNTKFIEILPEKSFQLALGLRIPSVLIASFKILVNELAIDYAATNPSPRRLPITWAQRKRDDYGDFPSDPVDYASRALVERMTDTLAMLRSDDVFDRLPMEIPEWKKLKLIGTFVKRDSCPSYLQGVYDTLVKALANTFHQKLEECLTAEGTGSLHLSKLIDAQRKHYISPEEYTFIELLYQRLNATQRLLVPFFWNRLKEIEKDYELWATPSSEAIPLKKMSVHFDIALRKSLREGEINEIELNYKMQECGYSGLAIDLLTFRSQMSCAVRYLCSVMVNRSATDDSQIAYCLSDHLNLALDEKELSFLPMWAEGLDDGSGGVFQDVIPPTEMGPSEPGPGYHTGHTIASTATDDSDTWGGRGTGYASTATPSELGFSNLDLCSNDDDVPRSLDAQQSVITEGGLPRNRVVAAPESVVMSEQFGTDGSDDVGYAEAMFSEPAAHQAHGRALADYVENENDDISVTMDSVTMDDNDDANLVAAARSATVGRGDEDEDIDIDMVEHLTALTAGVVAALEDDEEMDFSDDGSSTLDGFE